jgi:hypothetical protein
MTGRSKGVKSTLVLAALLYAAAIAGCGGDNPAQPSENTASDRAAIQQAIAQSPELVVDFSDDAGELLASAGPVDAAGSTGGSLLAPADSVIDATAPALWGRRRTPADHPPVRTIEFVTPPDSGRALVRIVTRFDGWFYVDRTDDGLRNPGKKPLRDQVTRYALFRKIWFRTDSTRTDSLYGWRLVAVSPALFTMTDPARQTVTIQSVTLTRRGSSVTITDPSALLRLRGDDASVPEVRQGETVRIEAKVANTDLAYRPSEFVYAHVPINARAFPGPFDRVRLRMRDDGRNGDATAGDRIYTALWDVQDVGRHHVAIDVLNARTLQSQTEDDYNSTTWGVPYAAHPERLQ